MYEFRWCVVRRDRILNGPDEVLLIDLDEYILPNIPEIRT
jgi:hypothetical protein